MQRREAACEPEASSDLYKRGVRYRRGDHFRRFTKLDGLSGLKDKSRASISPISINESGRSVEQVSAALVVGLSVGL